jgi:hypothetical protein
MVMFSSLALGDELEKPGKAFVDNGTIRLGVDLESGGSIFYFSLHTQRRNLLNHCDRGRFIQQSYYGDKDGSLWGRQEWRWNPVQGGDYKGHPAQLLEYRCTTDTLYCKSTPKHWATGADITDAVMEQWVSLTNDVAHIRYRFLYTGDHTHGPTHQEMPAVFVDHALPLLVFYKGDKPWQQDTLSSKVPGWPNEYQKRTEEWSAYVDEDNRGIGVYTPGTHDITCYRFEGPDGPEGSGCSYFAPIRTLAVKKGLNLEYNVYLTIGSVHEIRKRFYKIHSSKIDSNTKH